MVMRKIIPLLFSIVLLCASCVREAEFDDNFNTAYNNMGDALVLGITMAEEISQGWYKAILKIRCLMAGIVATTTMHPSQVSLPKVNKSICS